MTADSSGAIVPAAGFDHVRLTVTDIGRSKAFYQRIFGGPPSADFSDQADQPGVRDDPDRLYGGCVFTIGDAVLGLRPVADAGDTFRSTRVGLDHLSFRLATPADVHTAARLLDEAGIEHGQVRELGDFGMVILSVQDPDDINLEVSAGIEN